MTNVLDELKNIQNDIDDKIARMRSTLDDVEHNVTSLVRMVVGLSESIAVKG